MTVGSCAAALTKQYLIAREDSSALGAASAIEPNLPVGGCLGGLKIGITNAEPLTTAGASGKVRRKLHRQLRDQFWHQ